MNSEDPQPAPDKSDASLKRPREESKLPVSAPASKRAKVEVAGWVLQFTNSGNGRVSKLDLSGFKEGLYGTVYKLVPTDAKKATTGIRVSQWFAESTVTIGAFKDSKHPPEMKADQDYWGELCLLHDGRSICDYINKDNKATWRVIEAKNRSFTYDARVFEFVSEDERIKVRFRWDSAAERCAVDGVEFTPNTFKVPTDTQFLSPEELKLFGHGV